MMNQGFFEQVYEVARLIPRGKVTTYGAIAAFLGTKQSARMVGWAMNKAPTDGRYVPAHRVVNRTGLLTGKHYFEGSKVMEELLASEGIKVIDDLIVDFKKHFWDPCKELDLQA